MLTTRPMSLKYWLKMQERLTLTLQATRRDLDTLLARANESEQAHCLALLDTYSSQILLRTTLGNQLDEAQQHSGLSSSRRQLDSLSEMVSAIRSALTAQLALPDEGIVRQRATLENLQRLVVLAEDETESLLASVKFSLLLNEHSAPVARNLGVFVEDVRD